MKTHLTWDEVGQRAWKVAYNICQQFPNLREIKAYPVPRGGIPAAQAVQAAQGLPRQIKIELVEDPGEAHVIIDDLIDSGATMGKFAGNFFYSLIDKRKEDLGWVVFPWERMGGEEEGPAENIRRLIEFIGDDPNREGLKDTPARVIRSYGELFSGYGKKPEDVMTVFTEDSCDEMVIVRDVEFYSTCEHHLLPFFGRAHIAYIPDDKVLGVSKLVRLLEIFSRRLQIQERLCEQVTEALDLNLQPKGSACILEAQHFCMTSRGVQKQHSTMITSSLTGVFRESGNAARSEFLSMVKGG